MKRRKKITISILAAVMLIIAAGFVLPTWTPAIHGDNAVSTLETVDINGAPHALMLRGQDTGNPVVIVVHGGPACSEIPYAAKYQQELEQHYTFVHYDQRGSGKSYRFGQDYSDITAGLLVEDLLVLTDYIAARFGQDRVYLWGHSFGTYIATQAAAAAPQKYLAYIGIGQMSNEQKSELASLDFCIEQALLSGNEKDVSYLEGLRDAVSNGELLTPRSYVRKYGGAARGINETADYAWGFLFRPEYNLTDAVRYSRGIAATQQQLLREAFDYPLEQLVPTLDIPCYFVMGRYNYMTAYPCALDYYEQIEAPEKEFVVFEDSAHYPQFEEADAFTEWFCQTFQ